MAMSVTDRIAEIIHPSAEALDLEIVRVSVLSGSNNRKSVLQIMAERADGTMSVDDCAKLSREISVLLDVEDPISGEYVLEVSSPGVDRPLTRPKDFINYAGHLAKIELAMAVDGRRRFKATVLGMDGDDVRVKVDGEDMTFGFDNIVKAKLVLTDELLASAGNAEAKPS